MSVTLWHNPRCSKSRAVLAMIRERGIEPEVVEYLKTPPSADEIRAVLARLGLPPRALMRTGEAVYKDLGLATEESDERLIAAMAENPILIERPVVLTETGAQIGRPPERVLEIL